MTSLARCPVCGLPPALHGDYRGGEACTMWYFARERGYVPNSQAMVDCWRRAKDKIARIAQLEARVLELVTDLKATKRALSRLHDKSNRREQPFRHNARIE